MTSDFFTKFAEGLGVPYPVAEGAGIAVLYGLFLIVLNESGYAPEDPKAKELTLLISAIGFILLQINTFAPYIENENE